MKKILIMVICLLIPIKAYSWSILGYDFIDTLRTECGRILFNLNEKQYISDYRFIEKRNSQYYALEQCLKLYKQNGGNIEKLNSKYKNATSIIQCDILQCQDRKTTNNECIPNESLFNDLMRNEDCDILALYGKQYKDCIGMIKINANCKQEVGDTFKEK